MKKGVSVINPEEKRQQLHSIRKFKVGTASILIGVTLIFGVPKVAYAEEMQAIQSNKQANDSSEETKSNNKQQNNLHGQTTEEQQNISTITETNVDNSKALNTADSSTSEQQDNDITTDATTNSIQSNENVIHQNTTNDAKNEKSNANIIKSKNETTTNENINPQNSVKENLTAKFKNTTETTNQQAAQIQSTTQKSTSAQTTLKQSRKLVQEKSQQDTTVTSKNNSNNSDQNTTLSGVTYTGVTPFTNSNGDKTNEEKVVTTQPITVKQRRALMVKSNYAADTSISDPKVIDYPTPKNSKYSYMLHELGYNATTVSDESSLRFAGITQNKNSNGSTITLNLKKWNSATTNLNNGKINLSFSQSKFFSQIESISFDGTNMITDNNGQNWYTPASNANLGLIGSVTNSPIIITLKNNQSLTSLGYSNTNPVYFTHTWTLNDGSIAPESIQNALITPTLNPKVPQSTQSSGFTTGRLINKIDISRTDNTIKSIHSFKPDENFLQTDYNWVLYVKEQIPKELMPYIDRGSINIYVSDIFGNPISSDRNVQGFVDDNGFFDSSKINEISIKDNNTTSHLNSARGSLDHNVFYGTLGQSRNYTISYKLKDGVTIEQLQRELSDRLTFSSWLETDYLDSRDNGSANNRLMGSYASSYVDLIDRVPPEKPVANNITTDDKAIIGTAEANTKINLAFSDGRILTGTVDSNGNFSVSIPSGFNLTGKETISITAIDKGLNVSQPTTITVTDTTPPSLEDINSQVVLINTAINNVKINATDNSGDPIKITISQLPNGVSYNSDTQEISGKPTQVGVYPITVTATDASGNVSTTSFAITARDITAPDVKPIENQTIEINTAISNILINATDDSGLPVNNTVSGLPDGVTFDSTTNTISGIATKVGTYPIVVTSTDADGNRTDTKFNIKVVDTTAPTVKEISDQTKEVNTAIDDIEISATDNSGQAVTNKVSGLPQGVTFDPRTSTISGVATKVGTYPIVVISTDADGNSVEMKFNIKVVDTTAPTVKEVSDQTKEVNTAIDNIEIRATDNSGQAVTNTVRGLPEGVTFDPRTNTISGVATKVGTYPIVVTSTDADGNSVETKFNIKVVDTTAPTVKEISDQTKEVNTAIDNIEIRATDNSGQAVTNTVRGLPEGVTFDSRTSTISGVATKVGTYPIVVTSTDADGNSVETKFTIKVVDTTAPTVKGISDQTKEVNTEIDNIEISATDNSGEVVTNRVSGLPEGVTFDSRTNTISGVATKVGTYPIVVISTDAEGNSVETKFIIKVVDTTAPTVKEISDQTKEVNTEIDNIEIRATDNSGQPVTNTVSGLPSGVTFDPTTNTISGIATKVGTYPIVVTSTDAEGNSTETKFSIKVVDTTAPTVKEISDQTKEVNTEIDNIEIRATDNSGQLVTNTVSGLPSGVTFDPTTNTISGIATKVGTYPIVVISTDAEGNSTETKFSIKVVDTTAPTVKEISDQTKEVNTKIDNIEISATDNSGQPVTNTVRGLPSGVTFDSRTNTISGVATKVGTYPIVVTSTDADGNRTETKFNIKVVDTTAPTVKGISDQTKEVNTAIDDIEISATDNSGQAVTTKVSGLPEGVTFDPRTSTISGVATKVGTYPIVVTSIDGDGNRTDTKFNIKVVDTTAPTVKGISDQTKEVNTAIDDIEISVTDNSGQAVTNKVSGLPQGVTFDPSTNTISGVATKVGTYPIVVTSTDADGNSVETKFTIKVVDTTAPTVKGISDQTKEVNTEIDNIEIRATDNSGQPVTNTVSGLPSGVTFDPTTNTISGIATKVGTYPIVVISTDAEGNSTETKFSIKVVDTTAPTVKEISDQTKEVNTEIDNIEISATDNSGQPVTNTVSGLPSGVTFDPTTNTISGIATKVGTYPIVVTSTDAEGNSTETKFSIKVVDTTAPTVKEISDQTKEVNTEIDNIEIRATDNSGQLVTNTVSGLPSGVTFDPTTNTISGIATKVGTYPIVVISTDAEGNSTETKFSIKVVDTTAPTVKEISDQTKEVNTKIDNIEISATDNSGQPVTNTVRGLPSGVTFDSRTNTISGVATKVGTYPIVVTSTDADGNRTETKFNIKVVDTTAPTVKGISDQTKEVNTAIDDIEISATDNSGQAVTTKVSGLPEGVTFDPRTSTISGVATKVGTYPIVVTSIDGDGNRTDTKFNIKVVDTTAPTVKGISDQTKEVNTAIDDIEISVTDNSGQAVTNKVSGLPQGVTFDPSTNTISGVATKVGTYPIVVTSTGADGNSVETKFTIKVVDTTAPTVKEISDQTKEVNTAIDNIEIRATDNSGQAVTNTVRGLPEGVTFDSRTSTISGVATKVGTYPIVVTSTDADGNSVETKFTIKVVDTTAPTVKGISDQTKEVNTEIDNIEIRATDNSGQPVTNTVSGLPSGVTFDPTTNTISGIATKVGTYPIVVISTDADGNSTETKFNIKVVDTTAPTVKEISDQTKEVNTEIDNIKIDARDNSGQAVTNTVRGLPEGVTFDPSTNTISGIATKVGTYPIVVTSTDAEGNSIETKFSIKVVDTTAPTVKGISDQTKEVNTAIDDIEIRATDNSGEVVTNKVSGLPEGVTFDPRTNTISGVATKVGTYPIVVTSTDAEGNSVETKFSIKVVDTTAPTVKEISDQTKEVNTEIDNIEISATDNSGEVVTNRVRGLPSGVTFDSRTNTISGVATKVGTYPIVVISTDAEGNSVETKFIIKVVDTTAPTVKEISDQTKEVNTEIDNIEISATDNSGEVVTNKVSGLPEGVTFDPKTNTISGVVTKVGIYPIVVTSTDNQGNKVDTTFTIKIVDTTAPTVKEISDQTKEVNTAIDEIVIDATDNSGQAVTNKVSGLPEGVTFNPTTNTISGIATKVGTYPIVVTSTDAEGNSIETKFSIKVVDTTAPTVKEISDQTKEVNIAIDDIEIRATDNSGQAVTNKVSGLPQGVTFDPSTNTISGVATKVGTYPIVVTSTDADGNSVEMKFNIKVVDTTAPTVKEISDQTKEVNTAIDDIEISATDNSGQPVTNTVSGLPEGVTFDPRTSTISGVATKVGTYPIVVTSIDGDGNRTDTKFNIKVVDTTAPTVKGISDQTKEVNTAIDDIEISATDNSGQAVTNKVSGLPQGVTFDPRTSTISGVATKVGTYPIVVISTDADGNSVETKFIIKVVDTTAPTVKGISDQTKEVNTEIDNIEIRATDNSGQPVTNTVSGLPSGVTFDPTTNTISGIATKVGTYPIVVISTDADGNSTETKFNIKVVDTTAPTVKEISDQTKEVNTEIDNIKIDARDNSGQAVTNTVRGLPEGVTFDPSTNTISGIATKVGTYPIVVTSTDAEGNSIETKFSIKVVDTTAPTVKGISDQTKEVNTAIDDIEIRATDNSGEVVTNKVSGLPEGVTFDPRTNTISGVATKVGTYPIVVTSTDAEGNSVETKFSIKVVDTTAPTVKEISDQTKEVNTEIDNIEISATDNSGEVVTNRVRGLPSGVTFDSRTNTISGVATKVGTYPIVVISTDAEGNSVETKFIIKVVDTTAPTVKEISDQTKEVNTAIDSIKIDAKDNSGQAVTNKVSGLPEGVTFDSSTNTISGVATKVGTYPIVVTSTDADGNRTDIKFIIKVVDTTAPTVKEISDQTKEVNTAIDSIKIDAKDNSGQAVTNKVSGLPNGVTFDSRTNTISGVVTKVGTYPIVVTSTDADGNSIETKFIIKVVDTTAPTVKGISNQTKEVNTSIDEIVIDATDNSGQTMTNTVSGLPEGITFDSRTNTISGVATKVGTYPIVITSTDADGNSVETKFNIKVVDTTAPTVKGISNQTKEVNTAIDDIEISAKDNSGQPVTTKVSGLPNGVTFDSRTNTISGVATKVGTYPIVVTSTDADGNRTETKFIIKVVDTTAPTVKEISDQTKEVNTEIDNIKIDARDNSGQAVTNTVRGLPEGVTFDPRTNTISGVATKVGTYPIVVTSTDVEGNSIETKFSIKVVDTTAPTVKEISDQTKEVNTAIDSIEIRATDNSGQAVTNKVSGLPQGVTFDPSTNTISGVATKVGTYPIVVTSTDAYGNRTDTKFNIKVVDTTAPTVKGISDQTKEVNTAIDDIEISVTDNSGQAVTNKVSGLPQGVTFDSRTNTISGVATKVGTYPIVVTSTDAEGNSIETKFSIKVVDTTAPTVKGISDQTKEVNTEIDNIKIDARDNSGQAVTNTVNGLPEGVTFDSRTNTISGVVTKVGTYPIIVTSTDADGNSVETKFIIKVVDTTAPTVKEISDQTKEVNTAIDNIEIRATDNSGQPVTTKVSGLPEGVTFDSRTNIISGVATKVGTYPIVVTSTDAEGNSVETKFIINVIDEDKLEIQPIPNQIVKINTHIKDVKIIITGGLGSTIISVSGLPKGLEFKSETLTISGIPKEPGRYDIIVTVIDSNSNQADVHFVIEVINDDNNKKPGKNSHIDDPEKPVIDNSHKNGIAIHGKTNSSKHVIIDLPSELTKTVNINNPGNYTIWVSGAHKMHKESYRIVERDKDNDIYVLPDTGNNSKSSTGIVATVLAMIGGILLLFKRRKNDEEK
ncbi:putative Ig domain-containing protein [Staphylococcus lugdunensis]|nr:putative Ig domain-containing protein [Staphylococcus lugdunensis]UZW91549.1 putative Ig domain-containing protein [Staphylococcus lugdunensis]